MPPLGDAEIVGRVEQPVGEGDVAVAEEVRRLDVERRHQPVERQLDQPARAPRRSRRAAARAARTGCGRDRRAPATRADERRIARPPPRPAATNSNSPKTSPATMCSMCDCVAAVAGRQRQFDDAARRRPRRSRAETRRRRRRPDRRPRRPSRWPRRRAAPAAAGRRARRTPRSAPRKRRTEASVPAMSWSAHEGSLEGPETVANLQYSAGLGGGFGELVRLPNNRVRRTRASSRSWTTALRRRRNREEEHDHEHDQHHPRLRRRRRRRLGDRLRAANAPPPTASSAGSTSTTMGEDYAIEDIHVSHVDDPRWGPNLISRLRDLSRAIHRGRAAPRPRATAASMS